ncbi:hypothetical protein DQ04_00711020 [Trypanosoma grayi]|uniref:hypothetical protein n=1 Tax=Trypanosoma grayi TaxID=71804 RepID=UPI0004F40CBD|nr:hypothetical protein DQ04_00711020 [Trypanosoma grayi]KEG13924.1 hypothetical protein DQ04_00711020 [Trypanosoma grayi]
MRKTTKHAEVKPSKFRTTLCDFYRRQEECPFGSRCAFAHGEHELQTEERNVELLKATGLQRLDGVAMPAHTSCNAMTTESSLVSVLPIAPTARRQPVIVSLPYWAEGRSEDVEMEEQLSVSDSLALNSPTTAAAAAPNTRRERCCSRFSATCSKEAPLMYRHNPYGLSTQYH